MDIRQKLHRNPGRIELCWVPAHINISGNEKADELAKQGTTKPATTGIHTPFEDYKTLVRTYIRATWENSWQNNTGLLRQIKYKTTEWTSSNLSNRKECKAITRLRIGHTNTTHGHYARKEPIPICQACGTVVTVKHLMLDRHKYDKKRKELKIAPSLYLALGNDNKEIQKTIEFLTKTNLLNEI